MWLFGFSTYSKTLYDLHSHTYINICKSSNVRNIPISRSLFTVYCAYKLLIILILLGHQIFNTAPKTKYSLLILLYRRRINAKYKVVSVWFLIRFLFHIRRELKNITKTENEKNKIFTTNFKINNIVFIHVHKNIYL